MVRRILRRGLLVSSLVGTFAAGFLCGSVSQPPAQAQVKDLGGSLMKQAAGSGALGSVGDMGASLLEMQDHVSGLQKNIDTLKKVQAALTGK